MLNVWEDLWILFAVLGASVLFIALLNRAWPSAGRRAHNDFVGWQLSVLGTTYAVILGFMLYTVWTNYTEADLNVDQEASAVVDLYRLASGLPAVQRTELQQEAQRYAYVVVHRDWPEMHASMLPDGSSEAAAAMWRTLMSVKAASPTESTAEDHAISELSALSEHRRTRLLQSKSRLPAVLWCVLIVGCAMTIASSSLFGVLSARLHTFQVCALALLLALVLVAIADIHRPFQGYVHVSSYAFEQAIENMQAY